MQPLVSVIVCVYNGEKYIKRAVRSILNQTFRTFQFIIVDDGSTDGTVEYLNKIEKEDERIELVRQPNKGLSTARRTGMEYAKGEYTLFVDADDWIDETTIENLICKAKECDADMVWMDYIQVTENASGQKFKTVNIDVEENPEVFLRKVMSWETPAFIWCKFFRTNLYGKGNVEFPQDVRYGEDLAFVPPLLLYCKIIAHLPEAHYFYYYGNPDSLTNKKSTFQKYDFGLVLVLRHIEKAFNLAPQGNQYDDLLTRAKLIIIRNYVDDEAIRDYDRFVNTFPEAIKAIKNYPTYPKRLKIVAWCVSHHYYQLADVVRRIFGLLRRMHLSSVGSSEWVKCP